MATPPRLAPAVARRIDSASRKAHAFHRLARHPLCDEYAGERIHFGRRLRLCRGCVFGLLGSIVGLAAGLRSSRLPGADVLILSLLGLVWTLVLLTGMAGERRAAAGPHKIPPPRAKLVSRLLPAFLLAFTAAQAVSQRPCAFAFALTGLTVAIAAMGYRQVGPQRTPCASCPEARDRRICRGYVEIARRSERSRGGASGCSGRARDSQRPSLTSQGG